MSGELVQRTSHRPWPLAEGPWAMAQSWHDLLFAHWPIPVEIMRAQVPPQLALDTYDDTAWLGIVPFRMSGVRPRNLPALPWLSAFPELNVRTYVKTRSADQPRPGVYFFSLDAANPIAVSLARNLFRLPYFNADMALTETTNTFQYHSIRTHQGVPQAKFEASYEPAGDVALAVPGTLTHWLTERYSLYTVGRDDESLIGEIHHDPWPLQPAEAQFEVNDMAAAAGFQLPDTTPLLHFARRLDVLVWPLRRCR